MIDRAVPALPSSDLERTSRFFRYFDFETVSCDENWLRLRRGTVELDYYWASELSDPMTIAGQRLCVIRVGDAAAWHASFADTRMRWKAFGGPSLTSIGEAAWRAPAFCLTDKDGNLIWIVESGAQP